MRYRVLARRSVSMFISFSLLQMLSSLVKHI